jgi:hypothetical protein
MLPRLFLSSHRFSERLALLVNLLRKPCLQYQLSSTINHPLQPIMNTSTSTSTSTKIVIARAKNSQLNPWRNIGLAIKQLLEILRA